MRDLDLDRERPVFPPDDQIRTDLTVGDFNFDAVDHQNLGGRRPHRLHVFRIKWKRDDRRQPQPSFHFDDLFRGTMDGSFEPVGTRSFSGMCEVRAIVIPLAGSDSLMTTWTNATASLAIFYLQWFHHAFIRIAPCKRDEQRRFGHEMNREITI